MYDYHMHSKVSFDARDTGLAMALAAKERGLKEICFTDHLDYDPLGNMGKLDFDTAALICAEYDIELEMKLAELLDVEYNLTGTDSGTRHFSPATLKKRNLKLKYAKQPLFWRSFAYFCYRFDYVCKIAINKDSSI